MPTQIPNQMELVLSFATGLLLCIGVSGLGFILHFAYPSLFDPYRPGRANQTLCGGVRRF